MRDDTKWRVVFRVVKLFFRNWIVCLFILLFVWRRYARSWDHLPQSDHRRCGARIPVWRNQKTHQETPQLQRGSLSSKVSWERFHFTTLIPAKVDSNAPLKGLFSPFFCISPLKIGKCWLTFSRGEVPGSRGCLRDGSRMLWDYNLTNRHRDTVVYGITTWFAWQLSVMALHCRRLANADQHLLGKQLIRADNIFKKKKWMRRKEKYSGRKDHIGRHFGLNHFCDKIGRRVQTRVV